MAEAIRIRTRISVNNEEDLSITMTITGVVEDPTIKVGAGGTRISISKIAAGGPEAHLRIGGMRQRNNPCIIKPISPSMAAAGWRNEEPSKSKKIKNIEQSRIKRKSDGL
jgi:hypothetical protein